MLLFIPLRWVGLVVAVQGSSMGSTSGPSDLVACDDGEMHSATYCPAAAVQVSTSSLI